MYDFNDVNLCMASMLFFFVSLLGEAILVWWAILGLASDSTESSPCESDGLLRMGGQNIRRYLHSAEDLLSGSHGSRAVEQVQSCILFCMASGTQRTDGVVQLVEE